MEEINEELENKQVERLKGEVSEVSEVSVEPIKKSKK